MVQKKEWCLGNSSAKANTSRDGLVSNQLVIENSTRRKGRRYVKFWRKGGRSQIVGTGIS